MSVSRVAAWAALLSIFLFACAERAADPAAVPAASGAALGEDRPVAPGRRAVPQGKLKGLGPDEQRVAVFVLPGDASVEVDGKPVQRRDGVIELVGKVGDQHRLRVFKGTKSTEEKVVTLQEGRAVPSRVDLDEPAPGVARGKVTSVAKPRTYRFDE